MNFSLFRTHLEACMKNIPQQIGKINKTLRRFELDGSYLSIRGIETKNDDILELRRQLTSIRQKQLNGDKLEIVEEIGEFARKLACRGDKYALDENRNKVARFKDVRNWFEFSLEEHSAHDESLIETFDSHLGGKSGGQRERLSGAVLVASMAAQLGLTNEIQPKKSLRFCIIDEAFFKGSDEPVQYSIELFKKLGLQLIVITPNSRPWFVRHFKNYLYFYTRDKGQHCWQRRLDINKLDKELSSVDSVMDNH